MFFKDILVIILYIFIFHYFSENQRSSTPSGKQIQEAATKEGIYATSKLCISSTIGMLSTDVLSTGILSITNVHTGIRASSYLRAGFYIRIFGVHTIRARSASSAVCANSYAIHVSICTTLVLKVFSTAYAFLTIIIQN